MSSAAADGTQPLALLLQRLGADGQPAAAAYEALRRRLIVYFRLHLPMTAEDLADATLDRLAQKLHEGVVVEYLPAYTLSVARYLLLETRTRLARQQLHVADVADSLHPVREDADDDDEAANLAALQVCLKNLGDTGRELILGYYGEDGGARIRRRAEMAAKLGSSLNALRNRALRARAALEACMRQRLGWRDESPTAATEP